MGSPALGAGRPVVTIWSAASCTRNSKAKSKKSSPRFARISKFFSPRFARINKKISLRFARKRYFKKFSPRFARINEKLSPRFARISKNSFSALRAKEALQKNFSALRAKKKKGWGSLEVLVIYIKKISKTFKNFKKLEDLHFL